MKILRLLFFFSALALFSACSDDDSNDLLTVKDIDGNVYKVVKIGNQYWMAENLKVTHYNDGSLISNVKSSIEWGNLTTGAWCDFENDVLYGETYGHLYNGYTVTNSKGLAPKGWHVPTDEDWAKLVEYLGSGDIAGARLKEKGYLHWIYPNSNATNDTGFNGIAGGSRRYSGEYDDLGEYANFYSSTEENSSNLYYRALYFNAPLVNRRGYDKNYGFSIRCIKD